MLCDYGCQQEAVHQLKNKKWCCSAHSNSCQANKDKNSAGQIESYRAGRKDVDYDSFSDEVKLRMSHKGQVLMQWEEVFLDGKEWGSELLRKYLHYYKLKEYTCEGVLKPCNITEWHGEDLTLELDHINGKTSDNKLTNLRWLCPNCHSQTPTYRGYNKSLTGKKKITDDELLTALRECANIRQALQKVGLAAKGGNYERATRLITKHQLQ